MAIGMLATVVGLLSAIASRLVPGITPLESGAIYMIVSLATVGMSVMSALTPAASRSGS